ncbi:MAG: RNA polymerase sigma-70 factor [Prolixibacteraceae bacterium]
MIPLPNKDFDSDSYFLLEKLKEGDRKIFTRLFEYYYSSLVIYADHYMHDEKASEDIVQSVFVRMWENRHEIKAASIRFHLISSVKNRCIDLIRKGGTQGKYIRRQMNQSEIQESEFWAESELKEMIETAIAKLPPRCREIFLLSRFEGLKSKEIAQQLNLSPRTVETQIAHALRVLRDDLKDYLFLLYFLL